MKSLYLNNSGDFEFNSGMDLEMVSESGEVAQRLKIDMSVNEGEWFLNKKLGIPWIEMLSNNKPISDYEVEVEKILKNDPSVDKIIELNADYDKSLRNLEVNFKVIIDGETYSESVVII